MQDDAMHLTRSDGIAFLSLDNPPGNVIDGRFFASINEALTSIVGADVNGLIIHSSGRHFSSGADVEALRKLVDTSLPWSGSDVLRENRMQFELLAGLPFPVVAAIQGCCLGAGLELALACHYRVAAKRAVFSLPESTFGLMPGCGGTARLPALVGAEKAIELVLTGRTISAEEAAEIGLVDVVVEKDRLMETAREVVALGRKRVNRSMLDVQVF